MTPDDAPELRRILAAPEVARWWDAPDDDFPLADDPESERLVIEVDGAVAGMIQFAEDVRPNAVLPPLIGRLVAIDAFSQAFTNPLLSPRVFNPDTFSPLGWRLIGETHTLSDLLHRNIPDPGRRLQVTMTRPDWVRS